MRLILSYILLFFTEARALLMLSTKRENIRLPMQTGKQLLEAGADVLVAGSAIFATANPSETIAQMKGL